MIEAATILVADDSADDIELLKRAFQKAGVNNPIHYVTDGAEAIDYLRDNAKASGAGCPLLMLLDLNMPRQTGFAVLDWLRQQPQLQSLPTIVLSNSDRPSDIEQSFCLGAQSYWTKPSRFEDLVKMMVRLREVLANVADKLDRELPVAVLA
jgi:CheY-like chemotaxis protein